MNRVPDLSGRGLWQRLGRWVNSGLLAGAAGGALAQVMGWPLPWMMGTMVGLLAWRLATGRGHCPPYGRELGQLLVGLALALHFTPEVARMALDHAGPLLASCAAALLLSGVGATILQRWGRCDRVTAWLCSIPGGAAEMAQIAEQSGARVDRVAAAQALRVCLVVVLVPSLLQAWLSWQGGGSAAAAVSFGAPVAGRLVAPVPTPWLPVLLAGAAAVAWLWQRCKGPTAWFLGPLIVMGAFTAAGWVPHGNLPRTWVLLGQFLLGMALGSRLDRRFVLESPRFLMLVLVSVGVLLALTAGVALLLSVWSGLPPVDLLLASAPGGMAEMCATAEALGLGLGVAFVTASHVMRLVIVLTVAGVIRHRRQTRVGGPR